MEARAAEHVGNVAIRVEIGVRRKMAPKMRAVLLVIQATSANCTTPSTYPVSLKPNGSECMTIPMSVFTELKIVCGAADMPNPTTDETLLLPLLCAASNATVVSSCGEPKSCNSGPLPGWRVFTDP